MSNQQKKPEIPKLKPQTLKPQTLKPVLLISASDSSGAAGMQVDLRVADDIGHAARCTLTAATVQGERGLTGIFPVDPESVAQSIDSAVSDPPGIGSVKIGLITGTEVAKAVSRSMKPLHGKGIAVVLDPVMRSTPGSILASREVMEVILRQLLPLTTILTPNREELEELAVMAEAGQGGEEDKANALISMGAGAVLVTGGDDSGQTCMDLLYRPGQPSRAFGHPKIGQGTTRGTGCALSTALAVNLGKGMDLDEAVEASINYVTGRIRRAVIVGNQRLLFPGKEM